MKLRITLNGQQHEVQVEKNSGDYKVTIGESIFKVASRESGMSVDGETIPLHFEGNLEEGTDVLIGQRKAKVKIEPLIELEKVEAYSEEEEAPSHREVHGSITAPMPGKVVKIRVKVGDEVKADTTLLILEAMKMENEIVAGVNGKVKEIKVRQGESVEGGKVLLVIE
ncbi:MAG: biotin/lipoyl-containing protein [Methanomassiliicoccales archaeon]|jgi:biotin carboxyl carrier protein